jgi:hypothetical protein
MRFWVIAAFLLPGAPAAAYFEYAPNRNVMEEVDRNFYRILPRSTDYAFAIDGDFFKPVFIPPGENELYRYDLNHGNGYWLDIRTEFHPDPNLILNVKTSMTQGTSSNGPTYFATIFPRVGLTYRVPRFLGLEWETRLGDIDRQTLGAGLFIENKETTGGYLIARTGDASARLMVDGTGGFTLNGGVIALELEYAKGLIGADAIVLETAVDYLPPQTTVTVFSRQGLGETLHYWVEAGMNSRSWAGMAALSWEDSFGNLGIRLKPQFRFYGKGVLGDLPGQVEQVFVSYDQNDKPWTTLMNIFPFGDHVETWSSQVRAEYRLNSFYRVYVDAEPYRFNYHDTPPMGGVFYRAGFRFFPFKNREDEFGLLVGNKYLIASRFSRDANGVPQGRMVTLPTDVDTDNKPLFMNQAFWMIHYSIKL